MNTKEWAAWAEIMSSVAVAITVIFLVLEIRQNTLAVERQSYLDSIDNIIQPYMASPEIRMAWAKIKTKDGIEPNVQALVEEYDLSVEEALVWARHLQLIWNGIEADYVFQGASDQVTDMVRALQENPDNRVYWQHSKDRHDAEFIEFVESVTEEN